MKIMGYRLAMQFVLSGAFVCATMQLIGWARFLAVADCDLQVAKHQDFNR